MSSKNHDPRIHLNDEDLPDGTRSVSPDTEPYGYDIGENHRSNRHGTEPSPRSARSLLDTLYRTPSGTGYTAPHPESQAPDDTLHACDREDTVRLQHAEARAVAHENQAQMRDETPTWRADTNLTQDSPEDDTAASVETEDNWDEWEEWEQGNQPGTTRTTRWGLSPHALALVAVLTLVAIVWGITQIPATPRAEQIPSLTPPSPSVETPLEGGTAGTRPPESATPTNSTQSDTPAEVRVHVAGAVNNPGVYTLPTQGRAVDALAAASGASADADLDRVNLAGTLTDGMQLYVPHRGEPAAPAQIQPNTGSQTNAENRGSGASGAQPLPARTFTPAGSSGSGGTSGSNTGSGAGTTSPGSGSVQGPVNINTATAEQLQTLPRIGPAMAQRIITWREAHGGFRSVDELDAVPGIGPTLLETLRPLVTV